MMDYVLPVRVQKKEVKEWRAPRVRSVEVELAAKGEVGRWATRAAISSYCKLGVDRSVPDLVDDLKFVQQRFSDVDAGRQEAQSNALKIDCATLAV